MRREGLLRRRDGLGRTAWIVEDHGELVTPVVDHVSLCLLDRLSQQPAVVSEQLGVRVTELAHELCRAFDVGEDERDCSIREVGHQSLLQWDLGTNPGSFPGRTVNRKLPTQGGNAVGQPAQARATERIGAADPVVGDLHER